MNLEIEQQISNQRTLDVLRERRKEGAEKTRQTLMHDAIRDAIEAPASSFLNVYKGCRSYDVPTLGYNDLIAIDAIGYSPEGIPEDITATEEGEVVFEFRENDEHIVARRFDDGLTLSWPSDGEQNTHKTSYSIRERIIARYEQSPAHQALHETAEHLKGGAVGETVTTAAFDPMVDVLGTNAALDQLGFYTKGAVSSLAIPESLTQVQAGIETTVNYDSETGMMSFAFTSSPDYWYAERANQNHRVESVPFIETRCAEEVFEALAEAGLTIHPAYQQEMVRVGEAERFGSVYTRMSREIAKWVDRPDRVHVGNIFVLDTPDSQAGLMSQPDAVWGFEDAEYQKTPEQKEEEVADIQARLLSIDESELSEPSKLLFRLAKQSLTRDADTQTLPELPVTREHIEFTFGSCFDVAGYYLQAIDVRGLHIRREGGVSMLEKTHGGHTYLLTHPTILNGVELPRGSLMQKGADGGWAILRLTPFCFDTKEDQLATGSELEKAYEDQVVRARNIGAAGFIATMTQTLGSRWRR